MLSKNKDFVKETKKDIEIFRDMVAKWMKFQNKGVRERWIVAPFSVELDPFYIESSM